MFDAIVVGSGMSGGMSLKKPVCLPAAARRRNWKLKISSVAVAALCAVLAACQFSSAVPDAVSALSDAAPGPVAVAAHAIACEALGGTRLGVASIETAESVERGQPKFPWGNGAGDLNAPTNLCRVTAKLRPEPGSEITAQVWLPQPWNGKLVGIGGGGLNGALTAAALILPVPVSKGYVSVVTDAGHPMTTSGKFAHDSAQQYADYAYRANHVAAGFTKDLVRAYYGTPAKRAYFHGCSNGGRDALMLARRYPGDFDGIIAGAPAAGWSKFASAAAWNDQVARSALNLKDKLRLVQDAVLAKCDAIDGVKDGLLENPLNCPFDPAELQCQSGDGPGCLNADEVTALRKLYAGPRLRDGTRIYAGLSIGGEALPGPVGLAEESIRWMVYGDPKWTIDRFDLDRDYPLIKERIAPMMDSDDPDLSAYMGGGGKLLLYQGWNDSVTPAGGTLNYYAALRKALGPVADRQARLFMVPGVMHCGGGVGPNMYDLYSELDRWVEGGVAPERITATQYDPPAVFAPAPGAKVVRTRPLCAWPKMAHYDGSGSTDDHNTFSCR